MPVALPTRAFVSCPAYVLSPSTSVIGSARTDLQSFAARYADMLGVLNLCFLTGVNDFLIHVAVASTDDLRDFVACNVSAFRDNVIFAHIGEAAGLADDG